jgi:ATP-binding cassette subfamily F protein 3
MIELDAVHLQRGNTLLLENASLRIHPGEKSALVGANGAGKTSLFLLLQGALQVDAGTLSIPAAWRIAHMAQEVATDERRAIDYVLDGDTELRRIQHALEQPCDDDTLAHLLADLEAAGGYDCDRRAEQLLLGLGFSADQLTLPVSRFSGGWRIRLNLAQALMCPSDLLLLDEPTNHLDLDATLWLEQWLARYRGTLVLISHDRDFIDNTCDQIIHIDNRQLVRYRGNYSAFERQRAERLAQQQIAFDKQQERIAHIQKFVARFRAKASKAKQAQSRLKELDRMELLAPAHVDSPFDFAFHEPHRFSDPLLNLRHAQLGYRTTEGDKLQLRDIDLSIHPGSRIGLLGANGAGKSTLLKSLAGTLPLLSGERIEGEHLALGYFTQHQLEALDLDASPALHIQRMSPKAREQEIRDFLGGFNFRGDRALSSIRHFSGGEKARLALALIVWQRPNLLLLDEPTNHLDLEMCHALTVALQAFEGALVVVSHDRHLLRNTVDELLLVDNGVVQPFDGDLDDYSRWLLARARDERRTDKSATKGERTKPALHPRANLQNKQVASLKKQIDKTEKALASAQTELAAVEKRLSDNALFTPERKSEMLALLQQQAESRRTVEALEEQWLTLQSELEALV